MAHRENRGIYDTRKEIKLMRVIDTFIKTVYALFSCSTEKTAELKEIVKASKNEALNDVR